jgi:hypothetical protein
MTSEDVNLVTSTSYITAQSFCNLIRGDSYAERPWSKEKNVLCVNRVSQPNAPRSPGEPVLVFVYSGAVQMEDTCKTFYVFLNKNLKLSRTDVPAIRYIGTYTKVPIVYAIVEPKEWQSLQGEVSGIFQLFSPSPCLENCS